MTAQPQPAFSITAEPAGFTVYRDAEALQTPKNLPVTVPTQALAKAIMQECMGNTQEGGGERLDLRQMPLTQMTLTTIDITASHRDEVVAGILRYGESETLCLRAAEPAALAAEQEKIWQPYLDWCATRYKVRFQTGTGITPIEQSAEVCTALRSVVTALDAFSLTGLSEAVGVSGSLILGLALATQHADAAEVFAAAELEPLWQSQKWGIDPETQERHAAIKRELDLCVWWFGLVK